VPLVPPSERPPGGVAELTRGLAAGREAAFREFHTRYFDRLYQFLLVVTRGQAHAAQDAVQETFLRVTRHAREFEDEEVFWSWLKAIARNAARDVGRKHRRYFALLGKFALRQPPAETDGGSADLTALLDESLGELTPEERQLVEAKYLSGETVADLAARSGLSEKALDSRLLRLRRLLAEKLLRKLRAS
jgi:RNA polymerase sigma-70 factor (ECF subfamily)